MIYLIQVGRLGLHFLFPPPPAQQPTSNRGNLRQCNGRIVNNLSTAPRSAQQPSTMRSPSTSPLSQPSPSPPKRKLALLTALLVALSLLDDRLDHDSDTPHLALLTALSRHPPSLRVFRLLFAVAFLLFMCAWVLFVWEEEREEIGALLFRRLEGLEGYQAVLSDGEGRIENHYDDDDDDDEDPDESRLSKDRKRSR